LQYSPKATSPTTEASDTGLFTGRPFTRLADTGLEKSSSSVYAPPPENNCSKSGQLIEPNTNTNMINLTKKPAIIDHDINNPIEPRPYDHFTEIYSLEGCVYQRGNYPNIEEARKHGATYCLGLMDMGYSAILDGIGAVRAVLDCVGSSTDELGCEIIVNGYRRFPDIPLSEVSEALNSLIKFNRFNS
jgi:hypothetical protein